MAINLGNLKNFTKGDPRINRKGRPKKLPDIDKLLIKLLKEKRIEKGSKKEVATIEIMLKALINSAIKRADVKAYQQIIDRAYGKIVDKVDHTSNGAALPTIVVNSEKVANELVDMGNSLTNDNPDN